MLIVYPLVCAMLNAVIVLNKWHLSFDTISSIKHHCIPYIIQSVRYVCVCVFSIEAINCIIKIYCNYRVQFVGRCTMAMHTNNCQKNLKRATSIIIILFGELHGHIPQKFQSNRVENYYKIIEYDSAPTPLYRICNFTLFSFDPANQFVMLTQFSSAVQLNTGHIWCEKP